MSGTAPSTKAGNRRYAALTFVREGDGYVLGSRHTRDYVAVPAIGGEVVQWLQAGYRVEECAALAAERMGEPVDIAAFLEGLTAAGLLLADDDRADDDRADDVRAGDDPDGAGPGAPAVAGWARVTGRILFGPVGLFVQGVLALLAVATVIAVPRVRPHYTDLIVSRVPLLSMVIIAVVATASGLAHECAHMIAAAARGVPGRISISRRMVAIVYQTDLTHLWGVPRRTRVVPLLAGLTSDAATIGILVIVEAFLLAGSPPLVVSVVRALIFIKAAGMAFQLEVFMRTDLYALFVVATGCKNLWGTKGAVARRAIGRATAEDLELLSSVDGREVRWARAYLFLYVPGVAWTTWYYLNVALPALRRIGGMSIGAITSHGLLTLLGAAGAVALALTIASTTFLLWGVARTSIRLGRQLLA